MKKLKTWYKNTRLSTRVILSMNMAIFVSIFIISVFATINRINVQKQEARSLVDNELRQVTELLDLFQDRPLEDIKTIIHSRVLYDTGFISIVSDDGQVLICRNREGQNISSTPFFHAMRNTGRSAFVYDDPVEQITRYQYHTYFEPLNMYVAATIDKQEFINKPVYNTLKILLFALLFTWLAFSTANYFIMKTITTPVNGLSGVLKDLGSGRLTDTFHYPYSDEVGKMAWSVNKLVEGLKKTAIFAEEIGKNNFDHPFTPLSDNDVLGNALLELRQSLKAAKEEEQARKIEDEKRNWTTQGLAKFADILRQNNDNIEELSYNIIRNIVDYLDVNQGGIFIYNEGENNNDEKFLELTAAYAFDRRKYLEKKILPGEGLVGTCFLEKEPVYLTDIPQDYIKITSGLGDENPSSLLLIPLKLNEQVYGVIELASFTAFENHKLDFVEKIGESIASTISTVKINTQTAQLLEKSQQQAEEMRAQEEEMRQNMEELAATQESMAEKERENLEAIDKLSRKNEAIIKQLEAKEQEIFDTLEDCPEAVVRSDENGRILFFNKAAERLWGYGRSRVLDKNVSILMPENVAKANENYLREYLAMGNKEVAGVGSEIMIRSESGEEIPVFLTVVETRIDGHCYFTGFFTESRRFNKTVGHSPDPASDAPDDIAQDPENSTPPRHENQNSTATHGNKKQDNAKESRSDDADNTEELNAEVPTDPQKAWTEHISKKGKTFRKSRKK